MRRRPDYLRDATGCHRVSRSDRAGGRRIVWGTLAGVVLAGLLLAAASDPFLRSQRVPLLASIMRLLDPEHALGALSVGERLGQWYRLRASGVGAVAGVGVVLVGMLLTAARGAGSWWRRLALLPVALLCSGLLVAADNRGALVATAAGLSVVVMVRRPRSAPLVVLAAVLAVTVVTVGLTSRGLSPRTLGQRAELWENSLAIGQELPFMGAGLGLPSARRVYAAYFPLSGSPTTTPAATAPKYDRCLVPTIKLVDVLRTQTALAGSWLMFGGQGVVISSGVPSSAVSPFWTNGVCDLRPAIVIWNGRESAICSSGWTGGGQPKVNASNGDWPLNPAVKSAGSTSVGSRRSTHRAGPVMTVPAGSVTMT